jgi:hypothetical protein
MPLQGLVLQRLELRRAAKILQQRIVGEVGITKESATDAVTQHVQSRSLVSYGGIGLRNFVETLRRR